MLARACEGRPTGTVVRPAIGRAHRRTAIIIAAAAVALATIRAIARPPGTAKATDRYS